MPAAIAKSSTSFVTTAPLAIMVPVSKVTPIVMYDEHSHILASTTSPLILSTEPAEVSKERTFACHPSSPLRMSGLRSASATADFGPAGVLIRPFGLA